MMSRTSLFTTRLIATLACATLSATSLAAPVIEFITNQGSCEVTLDPKKAPVSSKNFLEYAQKGFYNGTIFHRVIPDFMVQGGGFTEKMVQKPTQAPIINESKNGLKNQVGTLAMARTNDPNSATAQFFINVVDNDFLNYKNNSSAGIGYAVFGKVTKGMSVINAIAGTKTKTLNGMGDVPVKPIIIQKTIVKQTQ